MPTAKQTQVIIVGAGPTGLSLACQLVRHGIDFVVIEKNEKITPFSKALGVHARTLEIYQQLGLDKPALERGAIAGKVRLLEQGEIVGEMDLSNIGEGMSEFPFMLVLEQSENERLLYEYLQSHGRDVSWQTTLEHLSQNSQGVTAIVRAPDGTSQSITGQYLVGCDGPKSPVRHALGLSFEGTTFERVFYVADVYIDWKFPHDALHGCLTRNAVVAFFPLRGDKRWRIVGAFPEEFSKDEGEILYEEIEARIREESQIDLDITRVDWFSTYKVHTRHVERFSTGRCFLAGDSAHIHTPAGGQGMNTGIQDAYNLAWKLAFVLKGSANEALLDTYNEERLPNAKRLLRSTDRMFNIAAGTDWLLNVIRTTIFPPMAKFILSLDIVKKRFFPILSQIGITYREQSLSMHDGDDDLEVKAGDRLPYFVVDGNSIYDKIREPKFHWLTFADGQPSTPQPVNPEFADSLVLPLLPAVAETFGTNESFGVLVRPDNYIGLITTNPAGNEVEKYFKEKLRS